MYDRWADQNILTAALTRTTPRGNTCASVHIAGIGNPDGVTKAIIRAYGKIGSERVKKAPLEGSKHVILRAGAGQSYVSVYDSDKAKLDNGELKDLALAASKALKTMAVFTSLYDSDAYEFIVIASGRQVDLLMTDAESYAGPFKRLSDKSRAAKWSTLFGRTITADQIVRASRQLGKYATLRKRYGRPSLLRNGRAALG